MAEINFWFPCILKRRIPFPHGQIQSSARRALVGDNMIDLILFFGVN